MENRMNLAGFGMSAWSSNLENVNEPLIYKSDTLPFHDKSLKSLSEKLRANCLIAHIRGVRHTMEKIVNLQNVHPFKFNRCDLAFAHNGELTGYQDIKMDLFRHIREDLLAIIFGTTDSEIMYAILMSQFKDPYSHHTLEETIEALIKTLHIIKKIRQKHNQQISSPVNYFISNGEFILSTRFVFNYGSYHKYIDNEHFAYHTLWYTYGEQYGNFDDTYKMKGANKKQSVLITSEPLTRDVTTWIPIPEYSLVTAKWSDSEICVQTMDMDI